MQRNNALYVCKGEKDKKKGKKKMSKTTWFIVYIALCIAIVAVIGRISNPTGLAVANRAPIWDYPTSEFAVGANERIWLDLSDAFFDPDGEVLGFEATPDAGINLILSEDGQLTIIASNSGQVWIEAFDGKIKTTQAIEIIMQ